MTLTSISFGSCLFSGVFKAWKKLQQRHTVSNSKKTKQSDLRLGVRQDLCNANKTKFLCAPSPPTTYAATVSLETNALFLYNARQPN